MRERFVGSAFFELISAFYPMDIAMLTPNYFGFLNNLVTLINYESFKEIGEIACVTPARSSRGQTLKVRALAFPFNLHSSSKDTFRSVQSKTHT